MGASALRILAAGVAQPGKLVPLFVYGTLRRGEEDHEEMGKLGAKFVGVVSTAPAYHLQHVGADKAALVPGGESIKGELYLVPEASLPALDSFELSDYSRAQVEISGLKTLAWAYVLGAKALFDEPSGLVAADDPAAQADPDPSLPKKEDPAKDDPDRKDQGPEFDPKWPKVRTLYETQMKGVFKDLEEALKHENSKLVEYNFQRMMTLMISMSKALGMRGLTAPLKTLVEKTFGKSKEPPLP